MKCCLVVLVVGLGLVSALPSDFVLRKSESEPRYQYLPAGGSVHLVDTWTTLNDLAQAARYKPDEQNVYHLFTRHNPRISQPLVLGYDYLLKNSYFDPKKRTILLIHGGAPFEGDLLTMKMVPALLDVEDVNVFTMDWSAGSMAIYPIAKENTVASGRSAARFIDWVNTITGSSAEQYHLIGYSLGTHLAGIIGRNVNGDISYITALDPAGPGWFHNEHKLHNDDATYIEAIQTMAGILGSRAPLGHVSFYPNGGLNQPGCHQPFVCDHDRAIYLMEESVRTGGFTGQRCETYRHAVVGDCDLPETLQMGGLKPKTGATGIYWMETNGYSPYSRG